MNIKVIGVWLTIALIGVLLYMLPALLKQLFKVKESFVAEVQEIRDDWKFARPTIDEHFVSTPMTGPSDALGLGGFSVGGAGEITESQPAPVGDAITGPTPMEMQGKIAQRTVKAPASMESVDGFVVTGSSPAPAPALAPATSSGQAPVPASTSCGYQYNPDANGQPVYMCNGQIAKPPTVATTTSTLPTWLQGTATKDGIDLDEATILSYWMSNSDHALPEWVQDLAKASTITSSEKKALASWAKENTTTSNLNLVKPTTGSGANTSTSTTSKSCKPKPKCKSKASTSTSTSTSTSAEEKQYKGPVDMGDYIRKDSIPCWACKL